MEKILVVNTGSTSTKVAIYDGNSKIVEKEITYSADDLRCFGGLLDQLNMRTESILGFLGEMSMEPKDLTAVAARGGSFAVFESGGYRIDKQMVDTIYSSKLTPGASWLSALIADEIAGIAQIPAYIYDAVTVDEMDEKTRISGLPQLPRVAASHTLNSKAAARKVAAQLGKKYEESKFVVTHMGGGISTSAHCFGKIVDLVADDEGTMSPERSGKVQCSALIDLCYSGEYTYKEAKKLMRGNGGLVSYLGTTDCRMVERRIQSGDMRAAVVYEAMALQIAKDIGSMYASLQSDADGIILTGGIANSSMFTDMIRKYVGNLCNLYIVPGSFEMEALASGILRIIRGEEKAKNE